MEPASKSGCLLDLKEQYYKPSSPLFLSGVTNIYKFYRGLLPIKDIKNFLSSIESYTLHREFKNLSRNPSFSHFKRYQIQIDLIDISQLSKWNDGFKYLLACIDTFTRKSWVRPLKDKSAVNVLEAFKNVIQRCGKPPVTLVADKGLEMRNKLFLTYCKSKKINFFHNHTSYHAAFIERYNKTIQVLLYKYMSEFETKRYIDKLDLIVQTYNNRVHRMIGMSPEDAEKPENHQKVAEQMSRYYDSVKKENPKYHTGQLVRIALQKTVFHRGYKEQSNYEVFNICEVKTTMPKPLYYLETYDKKEKLLGGFYAHEITPVNSDIFRVEKVIKTRKKRGKTEHFVKWKGYDSSHNSWISSSDVVKKFR